MSLENSSLSFRTFIFAHRGANQEAAENTRSAFDLALRYDIDGMETDVQLSRDGVPVLWHDRFLDKLGLAGHRIDDFDYALLSTLNFAQHFAAECASESVMLLQDFINRYRSRTRLLLEIKNRDWESIERHQLKVRLTLDSVGSVAGEEVMVSSFNLESLVYAQQCRPAFPLIYNFEPEQTFQEAEQVLAACPFLRGLCLPIESLDSRWVELLHRQQKIVAVYTCNSDDEINLALSLSVDILISDVPAKALKLRDR